MTCEAPDDAYLLLDWLNALIYEMALRRLVVVHFAASIVVTVSLARIGASRFRLEPVNCIKH